MCQLNCIMFLEQISIIIGIRIQKNKTTKICGIGCHYFLPGPWLPRPCCIRIMLMSIVCLSILDKYIILIFIPSCHHRDHHQALVMYRSQTLSTVLKNCFKMYVILWCNCSAGFSSVIGAGRWANTKQRCNVRKCPNTTTRHNNHRINTPQ